MYAPALRIWSLANLLMFLQLLLSILVASMSGAHTAAAVVAAAGPIANLLDSNNQHHPIRIDVSKHSTRTRSTSHIHSKVIGDLSYTRIVSRNDALDDVPVTMANTSRYIRVQHRLKRKTLRNRRHTSSRWHSRQNVGSAAPPQLQQHQPQQQYHISPNSSTPADQNWWRSAARNTKSMHSNQKFTDNLSDTSLTAQTFAGLQQSQQHVTRHHHHQDYHMHMPQTSLVDDQHAKLQQRQQFSSSSAFAQRTSQLMPHAMSSAPSTTSLPPAALIALQTTTKRSVTAAPALTNSDSVQPAFYAGNFGQRHYHNNAHHVQHAFNTSSGSFHRAVSPTSRRRFCSARDVATLAYEAPTVFEGKVKSMSADRRHNFSVTFEVLFTHKAQPRLKLPRLVRLQFEQRNTSGECDIYREQLRPRGFVRDLEQGRIYLLFVEQQRGDIGNFSILGRPVRRSEKSFKEMQMGVKTTYGECDMIR